MGSPRSGSTWLLSLLGEHQAVVPINEPLIGFFLSPFISDTPGFGPRGLDDTNFTLRKIESQARSQFVAEEFEDVWTPGLRALLIDRFRAHVVRYGSRIPPSEAMALIKEPNGSQSADLILSALPQSRLLFLLRDGRDVVDSELAAIEPGSWAAEYFPGWRGIADDDRLEFIVQSAHKWLWRTETVQKAFARHSGPKLLIRYESLRHDPSSELEKIHEWMGLSTGKELLFDQVDRHRFERLPPASRGAGKFARSAEPGAWEGNLSEKEQAAMMAILGAKLRELRYES